MANTVKVKAIFENCSLTRQTLLGEISFQAAVKVKEYNRYDQAFYVKLKKKSADTKNNNERLKIRKESIENKEKQLDIQRFKSSKIEYFEKIKGVRLDKSSFHENYSNEIEFP